jgi:hypothetical protein
VVFQERLGFIDVPGYVVIFEEHAEVGSKESHMQIRNAVRIFLKKSNLCIYRQSQS